MATTARTVWLPTALAIALAAGPGYAPVFAANNSGLTPPDKMTLRCENAVERNVAALAVCILKCQRKAAKSALVGTRFDEAACKETNPKKSCRAQYDRVSRKLIASGVCPPCLDAGRQAAVADDAQGSLEGYRRNFFCCSTTCNGVCVDIQTDLNNCGGCGRTCEPDTFCVGGSCTCPGDEALCNGTCTDTATDTGNCGQCGNVCPSGPCEGGTCGCDAGLTNCGGTCVDLAIDPSNCGSCGTVCAPQTRCLAGTCG